MGTARPSETLVPFYTGSCRGTRYVIASDGKDLGYQGFARQTR